MKCCFDVDDLLHREARLTGFFSVSQWETSLPISKPKFEMLVRLNAMLFTFPSNNITKTTFHATTLLRLVTFKLLLVMCSQRRIRKLWIFLSVHLVYRTEVHAKLLDVISHPTRHN